MSTFVSSPVATAFSSRTASFTVSAKNSRRHELADYTCDGVNDTAIIQKAINEAAAAGGGTIFLRGGTYYIASPGLKVTSKIMLAGEGVATKLLHSEATAYPLIGYDTTITDETLEAAPFENIVLRDMEWDGNGGMGSYDATHKGFRVKYIDGLLISNIYCHDFGATGIGVDYVRNGRVENCISNNNGQDFVSPDGGGGNGIGVFTGAWDDENVTIVNCHCAGNGNNGYVFEQGDEQEARGHKLIGCTANNNTYHGVKIAGTSHVVIDCCEFWSNGNTGATNQSNIRLSPQPDEFTGSTTKVVENIIISNTISRNAYTSGLDINKESTDDFAGDYIVDGLDISNCRFVNNAWDGLTLSSAANVTCIGVRANYNGRAGVALRPSSSLGNGELLQCRFIGGECRNNAEDTTTFATNLRAGFLVGNDGGSPIITDILIRDYLFQPFEGTSSNQRYAVTIEDLATAGQVDYLEIRNANMEGQLSNRIQIADSTPANDITNSLWQDVKGQSDGTFGADLA